jgi:gluconolactonase
MDIEIIGEGFLFPEGPIAFPDGSIAFVEILRGTLTRLWGDGRSEVIADVGGGPNGAALGPDGAVYICNNGGFDWRRDEDGKIVVLGTTPDSYEGGRIDRVDLSTGGSERIYTHCGEAPLRGPNDIVFDKTGGFWFTDLGKQWKTQRDFAALYYAKPDGSSIERAVSGGLSFNGVGLSPDEKTLYVADTLSARLWAYEVTAPGVLGGRRLAATIPGDVWVDSLAVTEAGNVCVGTLGDGGITTVHPDGSTEHTAFPEPYVTNICFGGPDRRTAYVTLSTTGRIARARWPEPGLALNFNPY